jgi:hypothetical protein
MSCSLTDQAVCLAEVKYGASPTLWEHCLPTWLMDRHFAERFKKFVEHGKRFAHLTPGERHAKIDRELAKDFE